MSVSALFPQLLEPLHRWAQYVCCCCCYCYCGCCCGFFVFLFSLLTQLSLTPVALLKPLQNKIINNLFTTKRFQTPKPNRKQHQPHNPTTNHTKSIFSEKSKNGCFPKEENQERWELGKKKRKKKSKWELPNSPFPFSPPLSPATNSTPLRGSHSLVRKK